MNYTYSLNIENKAIIIAKFGIHMILVTKPEITVDPLQRAMNLKTISDDSNELTNFESAETYQVIE